MEPKDKDPYKKWTRGIHQNPRDNEIGVIELQDWENGDTSADSHIEKRPSQLLLRQSLPFVLQRVALQVCFSKSPEYQ